MNSAKSSLRKALCPQEKNVKGDMLDGKIGRVYMPRQDVDSIVLAKPKV